ncbi:hypothetical protein SMD11_4568 [Streptomyces albireticuli]|uniref:Uncharacterized protein n=1 Tax=Streptomyces albireticuli TaxID=1940 RepID=A0A1Z2L7A1_9ACTN|nr:hypothetical protein SMD11_4568 [Streptomyces albireticuli]
MSVPGRAPPAASSASATRDPVGRRWSPGRSTLPATSTTRPALRDGPSVRAAVGAPVGSAEAAPAAGTAGSRRSGGRTGSGRPAQKWWTANAHAATSTTVSAASVRGSMPHRSRTHSGSRSPSADRQPALPRPGSGPYASPPGGLGPSRTGAGTPGNSVAARSRGEPPERAGTGAGPSK